MEHQKLWICWRRITLPQKFADYLDGQEPAKVYLRAANCGPHLWTVEVLVGVLDTGVSRSTCSWASSMAQLRPRGETMTEAKEKTLMRRRLMRRTMTKTTKDQKTSSRASAGEGRDHVHVSSARLRAEQEDKGRRPRTTHATPDRE
jgi:hypothetical protein